MSIIHYIFCSITYILILINPSITFKMIESVKSAKSVMSFFYYTSQAFSNRKRLVIPYIFLIHSLCINGPYKRPKTIVPVSMPSSRNPTRKRLSRKNCVQAHPNSTGSSTPNSTPSSKPSFAKNSNKQLKIPQTLAHIGFFVYLCTELAHYKE